MCVCLCVMCVCVLGAVKNKKYKNKFCLDQQTEENWAEQSSFWKQGFSAVIAQDLGSLPLDKQVGCWLVHATAGPESHVLTRAVLVGDVEPL